MESDSDANLAEAAFLSDEIIRTFGIGNSINALAVFDAVVAKAHIVETRADIFAEIGACAYRPTEVAAGSVGVPHLVVDDWAVAIAVASDEEHIIADARFDKGADNGRNIIAVLKAEEDGDIEVCRRSRSSLDLDIVFVLVIDIAERPLGGIPHKRSLGVGPTPTLNHIPKRAVAASPALAPVATLVRSIGTNSPTGISSTALLNWATGKMPFT